MRSPCGATTTRALSCRRLFTTHHGAASPPHHLATLTASPPHHRPTAPPPRPQLFLAGVDVFRLNLSHGAEDKAEPAQFIRELEEKYVDVGVSCREDATTI